MSMTPLTMQHLNLWGAKSIARFLGCSDGYVYKTLLPDEDCPVVKRGTKLFARRDELEAWTRATEPLLAKAG